MATVTLPKDIHPNGNIRTAETVNHSDIHMQALEKAAPGLVNTLRSKASQTLGHLESLEGISYAASRNAEGARDAYANFKGMQNIKMRYFARQGVIVVGGEPKNDPEYKYRASFYDAKTGERLMGTHIDAQGEFHKSSRDVDVIEHRMPKA